MLQKEVSLMSHGGFWLINTGWNRPGDKKKLLEVGRIFPEHFKRLLELAPADSLKIWSLLDMDILDTWIKDNMALLG